MLPDRRLFRECAEDLRGSVLSDGRGRGIELDKGLDTILSSMGRGAVTRTRQSCSPPAARVVPRSLSPAGGGSQNLSNPSMQSRSGRKRRSSQSSNVDVYGMSYKRDYSNFPLEKNWANHVVPLWVSDGKYHMLPFATTKSHQTQNFKVCTT